ncbi:MAG: hypothetical protein CMJ76_10945 [Planctomycetaceae bacterium]|nr:hypothetical protein [Planctomycetaceae bacterium]
MKRDKSEFSKILNMYLLRMQVKTIGLVLIMSLTGILSAQSEFDQFEKNIRPIFLKHCVQCHGEDKAESDLRLDAPEFWEIGGISGPPIVAGQPEKSLLLLAIKKTKPDFAMPPGEKSLTPSEIENISNWIRTGAKAPRTNLAATDKRLDLDEASAFWSFKLLKRPGVPVNKQDRWSRTPIDQFIFNTLRASNLTPVSDTDKCTLIRRATFDLTGLPPTPEEINDFLEDNDPLAFQTLVNRLLSTSSYGERWGRHWLDVARYADTAGDGSDYPVREAYKYRDWVINAFHKDKPYDEFIREQIAGDILAADTTQAVYRDLVTATGFLAIGKRYGYKQSPDYQHLDFADVIDSVGRSILGLSLGCARCHDHKYDPISAEDYYALYGIFESTVWAFPGGEEQKRPADFPALVPPEEIERLEVAREDRLSNLRRQIQQLGLQRSQLDGQRDTGGLDLGMERQDLGRSLKQPWVSSGAVEIRQDAQSPFANVHSKGTRGVRIGTGPKTDGIRYVFEPGLTAKNDKKMYFNIDFRTGAGTEDGVYRIYLGQGVVQSIAVEFSISRDSFMLKHGTEWELLQKIKTNQWYSLQVEIDSVSRTYSGTLATLTAQTRFKAKNTVPGWNGIANCFICDGFGHKEGPVLVRDIDNIALTTTPLNAIEQVIEPPTKTAGSEEQLAILRQSIDALKEEQQNIESTAVSEVAYGVSEGKPVNSHIQLRGEPEKLGDQIPRRFLEVLGGKQVPAAYTGSGRLQLAQWLTDPSNPLTARVIANRVWQWHFGSGLVTTPSDFGYRGEQPTHPALLDWLAMELIENNWSIKHLHRVIMKSRVYQLSSEDSPEAMVLDPENKLLWRYSRRPLDAESMRDAMLAVSGNLDRSVPGAHPFPDVNTWNFSIHQPFHAVYGSNHRSVYLMQQRNRRHPYLELFDSADPNVSIGKRQQTVTPTQALFLMNSEFVHAQAHMLAHRIAITVADRTERIKYAFAVVHGSIPSTAELQSANRFLEEYSSEAVKAGAGDGLKEAWQAFARVLLTSNSFLFVD